jgi:hypothetical protein
MDTEILNFKMCYAMEKIHGTSAHISFKAGRIGFFSGGSKYEEFVKNFDPEVLTVKLSEMFPGETSVLIYGEAYGGKLQGMSATYGKQLLFVAFDVKIGGMWLSVPKAESICRSLGLDFVHYVKIPTTLEVLDAERDADSVQAIKNGMGSGHMREGIVLRTLEEYTKNNERRVIAKHKRMEFKETATQHNVGDKLERLTQAKDIATEWVTEERLNHLLTSGELSMDIRETGKVIQAMIEDIKKESGDSVEFSKDVERFVGRDTALMFKRRLHDMLKEE